jgi:hypothetical protein
MALALEAASPPSRVTEVGSWVHSLARADLAEQEVLVMRAEEEMARRRRLAKDVARDEITLATAPGLPGAARRIDRGAFGSISGGLPARTFAALALSAAAGACIGATIFAAVTR